MARSDEVLDRQIRRVQRRRKRAMRNGADGRAARLSARLQRLEALRALPAEERPAALRLSPQVVQTAVDAALAVASLTPAGPALKGVKLGVDALRKVRKAIDAQDLGGTLDGVVGALRDELVARGVPLPADDELFEAMADALEERLDVDA
jgi:hypothetical protein